MPLEDILFGGLNEQGFLFQEKCVEVIQRSKPTRWIVHTVEHPVSLKEKDTRIDIIIRDETLCESTMYGVVECKKVNPQYNCWLFGRPLYRRLVPANAQIIKLSRSRRHGKGLPKPGIKLIPIRVDFNIKTHYICNWWLDIDIRGQRQRNQRISSPEPLEQAFIQVCRGVGGLALEQQRDRMRTLTDRAAAGVIDESEEVFLVPIIITTAHLYTSNYDLSDVDIATGEINLKDVQFSGMLPSRPVKWVMIDYGATDSITPDQLYQHFVGMQPVDLEPYNKRSIFIVNSAYISDFLKNLHFSD
jgi:hypothetical protein